MKLLRKVEDNGKCGANTKIEEFSMCLYKRGIQIPPKNWCDTSFNYIRKGCLFLLLQKKGE